MESMKIYGASKWEDIEVVKGIYSQLRDRGHTITLDWTNHTELQLSNVYAIEDIEGVKHCDLLIAFMKYNYEYKGVWVEIGAALALNIEVYVIGDKGDSSIFMHHPLVTMFTSIAQVISFLDTYELRKTIEWDVIQYESSKTVSISSDKNARKKSARRGKKVLKAEMLLRTMGWEAVIERDKVTYKRIGNSKKQDSLI